MTTEPVISLEVGSAFTLTALRATIDANGKAAPARAADSWVGVTPYGIYDPTIKGRDVAAIHLKYCGIINVRPNANNITKGALIGPAAGGKVQTAGLASIATVTANASTEVLTSASAHGLALGDIVQFTTTTTLPAGLSLLTDYYVISVPSTTTFTVSATLDGTVVNITDTGTGTHTAAKRTPVQLKALEAFTSGNGGVIRALVL
jgi:hypothetical protein